MEWYYVLFEVTSEEAMELPAHSGGVLLLEKGFHLLTAQLDEQHNPINCFLMSDHIMTQEEGLRMLLPNGI